MEHVITMLAARGLSVTTPTRFAVKIGKIASAAYIVVPPGQITPRGQTPDTYVGLLIDTVSVKIGKTNTIKMLKFIAENLPLVTDVVFALSSKPSIHAVKIMVQCPDMYIELVDVNTVTFQKQRSSMCPRYTVLTDVEVVQLLASRKLKSTAQLTSMLARIDPIAIFLGFRVGDVVRTHDGSYRALM
jgi:DNA-directed RNA polymerase subunit H (RpoH/RPB5)